MKYLKSRTVATSNRKENFPQCSICKEKQRRMYNTIDSKLICSSCKENDSEAEFVDRE